jgi:hypothetical protein
MARLSRSVERAASGAPRWNRVARPDDGDVEIEIISVLSRTGWRGDRGGGLGTEWPWP